MKNALFIVYYFPPMGGSGVQRPLKFIKYLKDFGWNPIVLCPEPGAYKIFDTSLKEELDQIAPTMYRVEGKTPFHLFGGKEKEVNLLPDFISKFARRFLRLFMYPDNKKGWIGPAVDKALSIIEEKEIDLVFSTAPPFSNFLIGSRLKRETGIPLVLDYRDSWLENQFFTDMFEWQKRKMHALEDQAVTQADCIIGLDEVTLKGISRNHPSLDTRFEIVSHGFDPADFESNSRATLDYKKGKLNLLYSGIFYEQNQPDSFLEGVAHAIGEGSFEKEDIHLHFQGGLDKRVRELIKRLNLESMVSEYGYLDHKQAVANLQKADALWMLENYDPALPQVKNGKLFEYFGAQKPILAVVNPGISADLVQEYASGFVADVKDPVSISKQLKVLTDQWRAGSLEKPDPDFVKKFNRRGLTGQLAKIFDEISAE